MTRWLMVLVAVFFVSSVALAEEHDFSGTWRLNANGLWYTMKIVQNGSTVTGEFYKDGEDVVAELEGEVSGNSIRFAATVLDVPEDDESFTYDGWLTCGDGHGAVAGYQTFQGRRYGWYAVRSQ